MGVEHSPCAGVVELKVEMRTCGVARITTDGDEVASLDGILIRWENQREGVLACALQQGFVFIVEALEVAINTGIAIGMSHIDGIAEAIHIDGDTTDIAVGNRIDALALPILRLDIYATMEMERARLTEIASKNDVVIDGRGVFNLTFEV